MSDRPERDNPIDAATAGLIRRKARELARQCGLTPHDRDDVEQDITLEVLRRLPRFDEARGARRSFLRLLVEHAAADLLHRAARPRPRAGETVEPAVGDRATRLAALARDVEAVLAALPADLRTLAEVLKTRSVTEAAEFLGVPRTTLNDRVRALRERFAGAGMRDYLPCSSVAE